MTILGQLFTATYNGVPFLVDSCEMRQGRKTQTFEYPNKKYRFVEDLGENLRTFDITAVVTGNDDYLLQREIFILALQKKGIGVLTHPLYGLIYVTVKTYTVDEDMTSLGECKFRITFEESKQNIFPVTGDETIASIEGIVNEVAPYLEAFFVTQYATVFKHNINDSGKKCQKLNSSLQPTKPVATTDNVWNTFNAKSAQFEQNRFALTQNKTLFASSISDLLDSYDNLGQTANDSYDLNSNAYYYGHDDILVQQNTAERKERVLNRNVINSFVNTTLLMRLYLNAMDIIYLDDQQILIKESDLEEKYQYLMANNVLDSDVLRRLESLRNSIKKFFNKLKTNISKVITVNVPKTPLTVLSYRYYANFDNENELISLNNIYNTTKISGDIKMLTVSE